MDVTTIEIKAHDNGGHNNNTLCGQKKIITPEDYEEITGEEYQA